MALYETNEVHEQYLKLSANQRFSLNAVQMGDTVYQHIIHTQKDSEYKKEYTLKVECPVDAVTVYIVGFGKHWLMLLQP